MIHFADVLHDLVRRGLTLRIDPEGNLFIYEQPRPASNGAVVVRGADAEGVRAGERGCGAEAPRSGERSSGAEMPRSGEPSRKTEVPRPGEERGHNARGRGGAVAPHLGERSRGAEVSRPGEHGRGAEVPRPDERSRKTEVPRSDERSHHARVRGGAVAPHPGELGLGAGWRGITWRDVPGHDAHLKKLNFSLLKRGLLHGHKCCARLEGEPLKLRLQELSERNRQNSRSRQEKVRLRGKPGQRAAQP